MRMNGHNGPPIPVDTTVILYNIASDIGEMKSDVKHIKIRQAEIIVDVTELKKKPERRPLAQYLPAAVGLIILAAASAGKVGWSQALPSLLGLVGK